MPRKGDGSSLRNFRAEVTFYDQSNLGQTQIVEFQASNIIGAAGRAAREAKKLITKSGRLKSIQLTVEIQ